MSNFNKELLDEINFLRTNPRRYSKKLSKYIDYFKDNVLYIPGTNVGIPTEEGAEAYDEAINFLKKKAVAVEALTPSKGLNKIAIDILTEYQKDIDAKLDLDAIIGKHGTLQGAYKQVVQFGSSRPEQIIINLVVSDGDKTRGQRDALLMEDMKKVGVAYGTHETYRNLTVITECSKFENTIDGDDSA